MTSLQASRLKPGAPDVGDVIAQKYRVEAVVGSGGMGIVVAARHVQLDQPVAIKLLTLPPDEERRDEAVARFVQEARAAGRLQSDHVVRIYDVGTLDDGLPFMVMELLSGSDLGSVLAEQGPLPEATAVDYVLQACAGIADAHRAGIVHRDLKPSNLFVTRRSDGLPLVKVLDFGISKRLADPDGVELVSPLTSTRTIMGSPHYMSPEQVRDARRVDRRTDIWALGTILQELLTGQHVFRGESFPGVCASIIVDPPASLRELLPDVTPEVAAVVKRCLEKEPERRFQSVDELSQALAPFGSRATLAGGESRPLLYGSQPTPRLELSPASEADGATAPFATRVDATLESARLFHAARAPSGGTQTALAAGESSSTSSPVPPAKAHGPRLTAGRAGWLALGAVVVAAAVWFSSRHAPRVDEVASDAPATSGPSAAAQPFTLTIDSEPAGASVSEGGVTLGTTPLALSVALPDSAPPRVFVIEKPGFAPYVLRQGAGRGEVRVLAALSALTSSAPAAPASPAPSHASAKPTPAAPSAAPPHAPDAAPPNDIRLQR